jgi:hypothetical protein
VLQRVRGLRGLRDHRELQVGRQTKGADFSHAEPIIKKSDPKSLTQNF